MYRATRRLYVCLAENPHSPATDRYYCVCYRARVYLPRASLPRARLTGVAADAGTAETATGIY